MRLLAELNDQVKGMGSLRRAWFTSFNLDIEFVESFVLPAVLGANTPRTRLEYEQLQQELISKNIDFRVFCDPRFLETNRVKRTCIPVHGIRPVRAIDKFSDESLFHPKVIYLEDSDGKRVIGAGSANLTISGWGRNLEVFQFFEITTRENYRQIRQFFDHLCDAAGIDSRLEDRRKFPDDDAQWRFVHSYQDVTFPMQLLFGVRHADLVVWSPYLPHDLVGLIGKLQLAAESEHLRIHLIPDLFDGKCIRTMWREELSNLQRDGGLAFYKNPAERDTRTELCHAKLWKLPGKLAIGSWNFTGPGSNCLLDENGQRSRDNNVEAGFIIEDRHSWSSACGQKLDIGASDCATPELLMQESLYVASLPPFDLHVCFDWHRRTYALTGSWLTDDSRDCYSIQLPGVADSVPLIWVKSDLRTPTSQLMVDDSSLLRDKVFRVFLGDAEVQRGLISELNLKSRRAHKYDTLHELLESLVHNDDPQQLHDLPFRIPLDTDSFADGAPIVAVELDEAAGDQQSAPGGISYFRLFQAMQAYQKKLTQVETLEKLDHQVFSYPGCLLELVGKTREEIEKTGGEVFRWFLAREVDLLRQLAQKRRGSLNHGRKTREPNYEPVPRSRWQELVFELPAQPSGVSGEYSKLVEQELSIG